MGLEMADSADRFQLYLDLGGKGYEDLRRRYEAAMRTSRQDKTGLLRVILEDWFVALETGEPIRPLAPLPAPDEPPPRGKSGERKRVSR